MKPNYKQILINLCAGSCLADHMGDMRTDIDEALIQAGIITKEEASEFEDAEQLTGFLVLEHNATTIWGSSLKDEDDGEGK